MMVKGHVFSGPAIEESDLAVPGALESIATPRRRGVQPFLDDPGADSTHKNSIQEDEKNENGLLQQLTSWVKFSGPACRMTTLSSMRTPPQGRRSSIRSKFKWRPISVFRSAFSNIGMK